MTNLNAPVLTAAWLRLVVLSTARNQTGSSPNEAPARTNIGSAAFTIGALTAAGMIAGHVTGGRVFGYDNVEVLGADGSRSHVVRRINEAEAAVVRRIFESCRAGDGLTRITKALNEDRVPAPRPQQGRPEGWAGSSVREVLLRPLYRGEIVWNQTRKRDAWGQANRRARAAGDWMRIPAPDLRIVSEELWQAAQARFVERQTKYAAAGRRRKDVESPYLLSGLRAAAPVGAACPS